MTDVVPAKVQVAECSLLVPLSKSKKLAQLAGKNQPASLPENTAKAAIEEPLGLKPEVMAELMRARALIDGKIAQILSGFPDAKKNKLFVLRFGQVDEIKALPIMAIFKKLGIADNHLKTRLLADLNYHGKVTGLPTSNHPGK